MADRQYEIDILIKARDAARQKIAEIAGEVGKLDNELDKLRGTGDKIQGALDKVNDRLSDLGNSGRTSAQASAKAFNDFEKSLADVERRTQGVNKELDKVYGGRRWDQMRQDAVKAFAEIERLAQKSAKTQSAVQKAEAEKSIEEIRNGKLKRFNQDFITEFVNATKAATVNAGRVEIAERAKIENEVTRLTRNAERDRQHAVEESLAKIAESRRRLAKAGGDIDLNDVFGRALGQVDISKVDDLIKSIKSVGLATKAEGLEIEKTANAARVAHVENQRNKAADARNEEELLQIQRNATIERERLAEQELKTQERLLKESDKRRRQELQSELKTLDELKKRLDAVENGGGTRRNNGFLESLQVQAQKTDKSFAALAFSLQGFQVAFAIKYAQALGTSIAALGGELVAVAGSAVSAGAALGGALAAGAAQAIGPVSILAATIGRITAITKVLNLQQQVQEASTHTDKNSGNKEANALDQIANATDSLANAQEGLADAQKNLTQARADAARKLQDLILAEQSAKLAAEGSSLALEDAQRRARRAFESGSAVDVAEADLAVRQARLDSRKAGIDSTRSSQDASTARSQGVEGSPQVLAAKRQLADANRALTRSQRELSAAQRGTANAADAETAAQDRLDFLLKQLSPSERELVGKINKLKDAYKAAFRPITDIIVESFSRAIDRAIPLFKDQKLLGTFNVLANQIAGSIDKISKRFSERKGFLEFFNEQSARNVGPLTDTLLNFADAMLNVAKAATPLFNFLVDQVQIFSERVLDASKNSSGLKRFFDEGKEDLKAFYAVAKSVFDIFVELFDPARDTGRKSLNDLAKTLEGVAKSLRENEQGVRNFFEESRHIFATLITVVFNFGREVARSFSANSVKSFADFLNRVVIPAIGATIRTMGFLAQIFHQVFGAPIISDITKVVATLFLLSRGFEIIGVAIGRIGITLSKFALAFSGLSGGINQVRAVLILAAAAASLFGDNLGESLKAGGITAALSGIILLLYQFIKALAVAKGAASALKLAFATTPFGAVAFGIGLVVTALGFLHKENDKVKISADQAREALDRQLDSLRALKDFGLESRDRRIAEARAEVALGNARARVAQVTKDAAKDGKTTAQESRDIRQAKLDEKSAEIDLERARKQNSRTAEDRTRVEKTANDDAKKSIETTRNRREQLQGEAKDLEKQLQHLKDINGTTVGYGKAGAQVINTDKQIKEVRDKLRQKNEELSGAEAQYRKSLRRTGDTWKQVGGNASDFGLTIDEVFRYLQDMASGGLAAFGAKDVKFYKKFKGTIGDQAKSTFSALAETFGGFAEGGLIPGYGLYDTVPIMAAPGEGILNRHQMPIVDAALRMSGMMGGGLDQLWSQVSTPHYMASGGRVNFNGHPGNVATSVINLIKKVRSQFPGMVVTSTTDHSRLTTSGNVSDHTTGHAVDLADTPENMLRASQWIKSSGLYKSLKQGIHNPNLAVNNGQLQTPPGQFAGKVWAQHANHIHLAITGAIKGAIGGFAGAIPKMRISSSAGGFLPTLLTAAGNKVRNAINKKLSGLDPGGDIQDTGKPLGQGSLSAGAIRSVINKGLDVAGITKNLAGWRRMLYARVLQESRGNPDIVNTTDINAAKGTPSKGLMQVIDPTFRRYHVDGTSNNIFNPLANMAAALRYIIDRYGKGNQAAALNAMVARAGIGYNRGGMVRKYASGGAVTFQTSAVKDVFSNIAEDLKLIKSKNLKKVTAGLRDLTADDGPLSTFAAAIDNFKSRIEARNLRRKFDISKTGVVTNNNTELDDARDSVVEQRALRSALLLQRGRALDADKAATLALQRAKKSGNKKAIAQAQGAKNKTGAAVDDLNYQLAQNLADIYEAVKNAEEAAVQSISDNFDKNAAANSVRRRITQALGNSSGLIGLDDELLGHLKNFQLGLKIQLGNTTNPEVRQEIESKIQDLDAQIAEATSQKIQDQIDQIQKNADSAGKAAGLKTRAADLLQRSRVGNLSAAFGLRGSALADQGASIRNQIGGLTGILGQLDPNSDRARELREQIDELNTQLGENTQAIQDNTDQLHQAQFDATSSRGGFLTGVLGAGQGIVNSIGQLTGTTNNDLLRTIISSTITTLTGTGNEFRQQLAGLLGFDALGNATGEDLVTKLINLSQLDTSNMTPAQQELFRNLINALLQNTQEIYTNNQALQDLNGSLVQDFSSSSWQWFRQAVFNGSNGLLPQFASLVPHMAVGGKILSDGLLYGHTGETIVPAKASMPYGDGWGNNIEVNLNQVGDADPHYIAKRIGFELKSSK